MEKRFGQMGDRMAANANRAATGLSRITQASGRSRFVLQNTANQLGDIAVQISGGTSASRAMSQQLPQLFGGFGALGGALGVVGPLLGTVAAVGLPVAIALANMGEGAQDAGKAISNLEKAVNEYMQAAEAAGSTTEELQEKFGSQAEAIRGTLVLLREISLAKAMDGLKVAVESIDVSRLSFLVGTFQQGSGEVQAFADNYNRALDELRERFNLTGADAVRLLAAINTLNGSAGPEQVVASARDLNAVMLDIYGSTADIPPELRDMAQRLAEADVAASKIIGSMEGVQSATGGALETAKALTQEYWNAVSALNAASGKGVEGGRGGDPRDIEKDPYWRDRFFPSPAQPARKARRGGGGGAKLPEGMNDAKRLFESTRTEAEKYAEEMERINELHRLFPEIVTDEVRDRAVAALNEGAGKLSETAKTLENSLEDMFASIVTGSASAKDAVASLLNEMSRLLISSAFKGLNLGGGLDGIFGGLFKPRAGGGTVSAGSPYMVGEVGPEPFFPKVDGRILSVSQAQSALRGGSSSGGSQSFTFAPQIDARGADHAAVARLEASLMAMHKSFEGRVRKSVIADSKRGRI
jgi:cell division protein ZapA (FtsZ GTPase activity inhibitor)